MKKLLAISLILFFGCKQTTEATQSDEWNLGVYHGKVYFLGKIRETTLSLKKVGPTFSNPTGADSVIGFYSIDTLENYPLNGWGSHHDIDSIFHVGKVHVNYQGHCSFTVSSTYPGLDFYLNKNQDSAAINLDAPRFFITDTTLVK